MTAPPMVAVLTPELQEVQRRWLDLPRLQQDEVYAREFAPGFARLFADLPLHDAPAGLARPRALVSVLGLSWQPVALMAAWARPERLLVLGTKESLGKQVGAEGVLSLIARVSGLDRDRISAQEVGDPGEADIYREVRDFARRLGLAPREVFVDPTGGKKSMSASAALAGFLAGAPLVYVDYLRYHGENRIPVAGTEYPRLLVNPLDVFGDVELQAIFAAFNRGDFAEAEHLARRLADRLYEPREAECLAALSVAYGAWDRFDFAAARQHLERARDELLRFAPRGQWRWAPAVAAAVEQNLAALDALMDAQRARRPDTIAAGMPLLIWYLAAAARALDAGKPSLALLLTYACLERYVDLCLWVDHGLDDESPDYARLAGRLDLRQYHALGRRFFGEHYQKREPEGPLMFRNGAQLLATLSPARLTAEELGPLRGLSTARNHCEYEHGLLPRPPDPKDVSRYLATVRAIVSRLAGGEAAVGRMLDDYRFPQLDAAP